MLVRALPPSMGGGPEIFIGMLTTRVSMAVIFISFLHLTLFVGKLRLPGSARRMIESLDASAGGSLYGTTFCSVD
jgi:hypothetical protein